MVLMLATPPAVMHKELDRIERNTTKVAEHPKMTQSALTDLRKEVKVQRVPLGTAVNYHNVFEVDLFS